MSASDTSLEWPSSGTLIIRRLYDYFIMGAFYLGSFSLGGGFCPVPGLFFYIQWFQAASFVDIGGIVDHKLYPNKLLFHVVE